MAGDLPGLDLAGQEDFREGREHGLASLEDLAEGNGTSAEGDDGAAVRASSPEADRRHGLPVGAGHDGSLAEAESPEGENPDDTSQQLGECDGPHETTLGTADELQRPLVGDVVCGNGVPRIRDGRSLGASRGPGYPDAFSSTTRVPAQAVVKTPWV